MFNNANVIFRTKFVDGVSTVARTIGKGAAASNAATADIIFDDDEETENSSGGNVRGKGKGKGKGKAATRKGGARKRKTRPVASQ